MPSLLTVYSNSPSALIVGKHLITAKRRHQMNSHLSATQSKCRTKYCVSQKHREGTKMFRINSKKPAENRQMAPKIFNGCHQKRTRRLPRHPYPNQVNPGCYCKANSSGLFECGGRFAKRRREWIETEWSQKQNQTKETPSASLCKESTIRNPRWWIAVCSVSLVSLVSSFVVVANNRFSVRFLVCLMGCVLTSLFRSQIRTFQSSLG